MKTGIVNKIYELLKEIQGDYTLSEEESKALFDNLGYIITEYAKASSLAQGK